MAGPEMVGLDPQTLEHAHVEIAQGRRVLRIEMQVLAVLEPKSGGEFLQKATKVTKTQGIAATARVKNVSLCG